MAQPIEPTFARPYNLGDAVFGIVKLVTEHQRDYWSILNSAANNQWGYTEDYIAGSLEYQYLNGAFSVWQAGGGTKYYRYAIMSLNYYPTDLLYIREVGATLRPVEMILPQKKHIDSKDVYLKIGIAKQLWEDGTEVKATLKTFDGAYNLSNQTNATTDVTVPQYITAYQTEEDVNANVAVSRVNGLRSYLLLPVPLATDIDTGVSFELGMTNEGRVFDYSVIITMSNWGQDAQSK